MGRFTLEQRWEILKTYFQSQCCVAETVRVLKRTFGRNEAPTAPAVRKFVKKVRETGLLVDNTPGPRCSTVLTDENVAAVAESIQLNPSTSTRRRSQELNISRTTLRRILHKIETKEGGTPIKGTDVNEDNERSGNRHDRPSKVGKTKYAAIIDTGKRLGHPKKIAKLTEDKHVKNDGEDEAEEIAVDKMQSGRASKGTDGNEGNERSENRHDGQVLHKIETKEDGTPSKGTDVNEEDETSEHRHYRPSKGGKTKHSEIIDSGEGLNRLKKIAKLTEDKHVRNFANDESEEFDVKASNPKKKGASKVHGRPTNVKRSDDDESCDDMVMMLVKKCAP